MVIRVFGAVEGQGVGFLENGKAKILFERHRMYFYLSKALGKTFANNQAKVTPNLVNTLTGVQRRRSRIYPFKYGHKYS